MGAERADRIELPCDLSRPALRQPSWQAIRGRVPAGVDDCLGAFAVFVGKVASTRDFVIGTDAGAISVSLDPAERFAAACARIADIAPIGSLAPSSDPARHPLYDVGFGTGEPVGDLHLVVDGATYTLFYDARLFSADRAVTLARALDCVLATSAEIVVGAVGLLGAADEAELLAELSSPLFNWPQHFVLHELFEAWVDRAPDATALVFGETRITYAELDARANAVAGELIGRGVGADSIVALICDRSIEMIVAIIGALKAGGAYLPIEPDAPADRVRYLLEDSSAAAVVTHSHYAASIDHANVIAVDQLARSAPRPPRRSSPENLAYVIYTSGSTGKPKGVLVEHRNVVHLVFAEKEDFGIRATDALILLSSYSFDASIDQIWLSLTSGAKLVLVAKQSLLDPAELSRLIAAEHITHLDSVPALLAELSPMLSSVRQVVVGGETCPVTVARAWSRTTRFWNEYGPTETTVGSLRHLVDPSVDLGARVPIGRPIGLNRVYVLDWGGRPVPIGVRGELFLGGAGVARGYLNRDELTRERFVADPFAGGKMYKTGDVVAWLADGSIEFFGRIDSQVKVRGFRIELGEIEAALEKHPELVGAAASVMNDRLVGHFVATRAIDSAELRAFLGATLPAYMVPEAFVQLDAFPRNVSGKIDRKALPAPKLETGDVVRADTAIEAAIVTIWSGILALPEAQISVTRSFFELGGHSLLVMKMLARIREKLGVALAAQQVLARPTIREIADAVASKPTHGALAKSAATDAMPATSVQRRMYVIHQGAPFNTSDNLPLLYKVDGALPLVEIERACHALIARHEALRTAFFFHDGEIIQKIAGAPKFALEHYDHDGDVSTAAGKFVRPFELDNPPLFRAAVFERAGEVTHLAFDMHHIISDGISIDVLLEDLLALVRGATLAKPESRYFDYSAWLGTNDAKQRQLAGHAYWSKLLRDEPPVLDLPYDFRRPLTRNQVAGELSLELPAELVERIARFSREREATPFAFFSAVYSAFLSCMTGSSDVIWGFPSAGRPHPELENVVGMFVNTLVFRTKLERGQTFNDFLRAAMAQIVESLRNEDTPFEEMVDEMRAPAPGRNPIFDTMLSYEGKMADEYRCGDAVLREQPLPHRFARTDLAVIVRERSRGGYWLRLEYSADLFKRSTAERLAHELVGMIDRVLAEPTIELAELHAIGEADRERLLHGFNATAHALPDVASVHALWQARVASQPDAVAVEMGRASLTYREVDARAHALAHALHARGIGREHIVGILLDPCMEMVVSVLGVMTSGAAFLPIDPAYPLARKAHMLADSGARVLVTHGALARDFAASIDTIDIDSIAAGPRVDVDIRPADLAYVIYTSGSTGIPKGTLIEHHSLLNFASWYADYFAIAPGDGVSKFAGFGFDASISEIVPAFVAGARLVIVPADTRLSIDELDAYFQDHRVDIAFLPTQYGEQFLRDAYRHSLRAAFLGGEKLRARSTERCTIVNGYGPTEYTVAATAFRVDKPYDNIPIGAPVWNTQVLVLDRMGRLSPIGVPGELCISGASIARGYLKRPDQDADKFVANPFATGERMYRTGDLARWRDDGNLEFLGRIDTQVKVRGFRVELGEIEQALLAMPGIDGATVIALENPAVPGDLALVAYVEVSGTTQAATEGDLKQALGATLPAYMIPSRIVKIDRIPLTANGKVDKHKLPVVEVDNAPVTEPRDDRESTLRELYAEILGRRAQTISIDQSFLELGGHSLKAAALLSAIFKRTGVQLKLAEFLAHSTIAEVAPKLVFVAAVVEAAWPRAPKGEALPLTSAQLRIFAVHQLSTWSTAYNIPFAWQLAPEVDLERLSAALQALVARHESLRLEIVLDGGMPAQRFRDAVALDIARITVDDANLNVTLDRFVQPFDFAKPPLLRVGVVTTERRTVLVLDVHHIAADGLSVRVLLDELERIYAGEQLAVPSPSFADYAFWEASEAGRAQRDGERAWWLEKFAELPSPLELPCDRDRPPRLSFEGDDVSFDLPNETAAPLLELAKTQGITPLGVLLAAWSVVLSRIGNTPDLVIGVPASGRQRRGMDELVGMFVNTVPLRVKLASDEPFAALCARLGREANEAFERQSYHLSDLVTDLNLARDPARNPLFDVMFSWQDAELADEMSSQLGLTELPAAHVESKFDLELTVQHTSRGLHVNLVFATQLFRKATAERFAGYLRGILEQTAREPMARVRELVMLQPREREVLLEDKNRTEALFPHDKTFDELFWDSAQQRPDAIAVVDAHTQYTFAEVARRANVVATELVQRGINTDDVVAIAFARSVELYVAILGVMRSGAGYLPIDPELPAERVATIIADSRARLLVTDGTDFGLDGALAWRAIDFARTPPQLARRARPDTTAYVIYTSGSTGKPKGVVIEHRSVVNEVWTTMQRMRIGPDERILLFASYTFDASVEQAGMAMAAGARLVIPTKDVLLDHDAFEAFLIEHGVTHMHTTPPFVSSFTPKRPLALRRLVVGGDILPVPTAARWLAAMPVYNEYGPTETTITSVCRELVADDLRLARIPIGAPTENTRIYILDWTGNLAPLGVPGDLYIGGAGVARGYLGNETLTRERFFANPFVPTDRLYHTGDRARWSADGTLDFLGRADNQIKIRGFRIELGEIEAALLRHADVGEAAVIVVPQGDDKRLCAYVVPKRPLETSALRTFLSRSLPAYMVPDSIVAMAAFPVTTSGKIDRKRLPEPVFEQASEADAPATLAEETLVEIWAAILKLAPFRIPVTRSFFELGGHSLLIMMMIARIQEAFCVRLSAADVFARPTIRALAELIEEHERSAIVPIPKAAERSDYPLTSVQRRMFAIAQASPRSTSYNIPSVFEVIGRVTPERLEQVVRALIARHASLRTSFHVVKGQPIARLHATVEFELQVVESDEPIDELMDRFVQPFDLAIAPLWRVWHVRRTTGDELVVLDIHHIIADGTSMSKLLDEVALYFKGGALEPPRIHVGDVAVWQHGESYQAGLAEQRAFWLGQYATIPPPLELPYDFRPPALRSHDGGLASARLTAVELDALNQLARAHQSTPFATVLAAWFVFLSRIGRSDDLVVGVPVSGRVHPDVQELVGMFVNTVPWRAHIPNDGTFVEFLRATRETSLHVLASQEYELESLIHELGTRGLFETMFTYQAREDDIVDADRVKLRPLDFEHHTAKADLMLIATESGDGLELTLEYASELFEAATAQRLVGHLATLLRDVIAAPTKALRDLELLAPAERAHLLVELNATEHALPPVETVLALFDDWVRATPDAPCVVLRELVWSYREVDRRANAIAQWLREHHVATDELVPILIDPCAENLPAVLGVLKSGAAFLPIDVAYPIGRKLAILEDSGARVLLSRGDHARELGFTGPQLDVAHAGHHDAAPAVDIRRDHAAYVIYTSGSTGKPKGVVIEHGSLLNFTAWYNAYNAIEPGEALSKYAGPSFDTSISELFPACTTGAALVIVPAELRLELAELSAYFEQHRVSIAFLPTQFGEQFLRSTEQHSLRAVWLAGEKMRFYRPASYKIINGYGPTEYTVYTTAFDVERPYDNIPIGRGLWNTKLYVLDRHDRLCPIGVAGELCVSGLNMSRGYLNRAELTASKFVAHPFEPGARMYRTGDLARWKPDGNVEYLGRIDTQVKIRGYRIELGEIEQALLAVPGITGATVVHAGDQLVAYIVGTATETAARTALARDLPEYMIPSAWCALDAIPLTPNGKVDKKALPSVDLVATHASAIVPPADDAERALTACFARVLGIEPAAISVTASFFELGGHSLKAIALIGEVYERMQLELKVSDVFRHPTVRALAKRLATGSALAPIEPSSLGSSRASSVQTRMFLLQQMAPDASTYNVPNLLAVAPGVTKPAIASAFASLAARYDAFRCEFALDGAQVRIREAHATLELAEVVTTDAELDAAVDQLVKPFDLTHAPLARATWIETETQRYVLFDMHHIVTDGTSTAQMLGELEMLLAGESLGPPPLGSIAIAAWENGEQAQAVIAQQAAFWRARFPDGVPALGLVTDFPRPPIVDPAGASVATELPTALVAGLRELARARGISMHALLLAAFDVLLARLARQDDIAVGTAVAGRWHPDMRGVVGMFVNTLVLANTVEPKRAFGEFAAEVARRSIEALDNQAFPFAELVELVGTDRHAGHTPLIDVMFTLQSPEGAGSGDSKLSPITVEGHTAKFDLSIVADESDDAMSLTFEYRTSLFARDSIERYVRCFTHLLGDICARPDAPIEQLSIVTEADRALVEIEWNRTDVAYPDEHAVHLMFARAATRAPARRCLVDADGAYTFGEVDAAANRLAHRLRALGIERDGIVAILGAPSNELVIAELAALKAGGAFMPIDHRYPRDRVEYMLRDSAARVLIAAPGLDDALDWAGPRLVLDRALFADGDATRPAIEAAPHDLAYVIYTSGSTGKPKGVMIEHGSLVGYVQRLIDTYAITERDRCSKYAGIGFDASIIETFPPLCAGGELHVVPDAIRLSIGELATWLDTQAITVAFLPTPLAEELMKEPRRTQLRWLIVGGDRLRRFEPASFSLANEYGPTEATVAATAFVVDRHYDNIPIGKPIANAKVLVLDPSGQACPPSVPGELCIGGRGLARGYLGAPELTAKKFTTDPRVGRLYHTGDLARWRPDGNLEFLGRIDSQVKLRGYRIELGEIEQAMLGTDGVSAAVVIDRDDAAGDKYLAGYFVGSASVAQIRAHLATNLPDYMVPAVFVELDAIPMTTNGKVDRKRLPEPQLEHHARVIEPAATPAEQIVVEAFAKALGRADVGATDDFFELGGNSLKAVAVVATLASDFRITTNDLFRLRTARAIGAEIPMIRGDLQARLITLVAELRGEPASDPLVELAPELARYRERYRPYQHVALREHMAYRDVLLTGATGFLGSYLLRDLLERSDAKVHITMRARKRQEAWDRLVAKTSRYFGRGFLDRHARRIHLVLGDLSEPAFGLDRQEFDALARTVDCVLHSAALTKHYGELSTFVKANVDATQHVCDLAYRAGCDLNVVSTVSVGNGEIPGKKRALFTEFDCDIGQVAANHYVRTKLDGEKVVHALRDKGLACNIFRVGFLTGDSKTLTFQANADDSGFVQTLQSYLALRKIPTSAFAQSFCPVDEVSDAIVRLMSASSLLDQTHHVDRLLSPDQAEAILAGDSRCEPLDDAEFYEWLAGRVSDREVGPAATAMLLHQGLLEDRVATETVTVREKTESLLAAAGFSWSTVRPEQVWSLTGQSS